MIFTERNDIMPRHGENIYKRKDGRWEARYVKAINIDGSKNTVQFTENRMLKRKISNSIV